MSAKTSKAEVPFQFVAASYLTRILAERAWTIAELEEHVARVPEASIFFHSFQTIEAHHYTAFSNDFAQWAMAACNEPALAEELANIDVRGVLDLEDLRKVVAATLKSYMDHNPVSSDRPAFEPFYFCEAVEVVVPLRAAARTIAELAAGIDRMTLQTLHHHFINSRLRLKLRTNDFSHWIECNFGDRELAERINSIDFYVNTLEEVRKEIIEALRS